jgi:hypothetical protein
MPDYSKLKIQKPKAPKKFLNGDWGPEGWFKFKVRYGDNWWNVAHKDGWADPWDLIEYNFGTRKAKEVNWYLRNFVGCTELCPKGQNFVFSDNLNPGYIHTVHPLRPFPPSGPFNPPDPIKLPEEPPVFTRPGVWWGIGAKAGAMVGLGYDRTECVLFSADLSDAYWVSIDTTKIGGGGGVGAGAVLVIASGLPHLNELKHCRIDGMDWGFSMGVKLKGLGVAAANLGTLRKLYYLVKARSVTEHALAEAAPAIKYLSGTFGAEFGNMPTVNIIDIPFAGLSVEAALYSGSSTFSVSTLYESDSPLI